MMFLSEIKILDLKRSELDTGEMDLLEANLQKFKGKTKTLKTAESKKKAEVEVVATEERIKKLKEKEKADRKKGSYKFKKKVYTDKQMADTTGGLDFGYKFKWNRDDARAIADWRIKYGFELVTVKDPYLPEGVPPDGEGKFVFKIPGDSVLMKITLRKYAEKQERARAKSDRAVAGKLKEFQAALASKGVDAVDASDKFIEDRKKELGIT